MWGVFHDLYKIFLIWFFNFYLATQKRLVSFGNPKGYIPINNLNLVFVLAYLLLFVPQMDLSANIRIYVDNTSAQGWDNYRSVGSASAVGPILRYIVPVTDKCASRQYEKLWQVMK